MAQLTLASDTLELRFTTGEKILGLVADHDFPRAAVVSARWVDDGLTAVRGLRSPGLGLPGLRKVGTWRSRADGRRRRCLVSVRRGAPAVVVELQGQRFDALVVGAADCSEAAAATQHSLVSALGGSR